MQPRLEELARELEACRRQGIRTTLDRVLDQARILKEAKELAPGEFGRWLRTHARMSSETARRHLRVLDFSESDPSLTSKFSTLSIAKVYALTTLDLETARHILDGQVAFSRPIEEMSDLQFRGEFREKFPSPQKRRTRQHVFQEVYGALVRAERALAKGERVVGKLGSEQRLRIVGKLDELARASAGWRVAGEPNRALDDRGVR